MEHDREMMLVAVVHAVGSTAALASFAAACYCLLTLARLSRESVGCGSFERSMALFVFDRSKLTARGLKLRRRLGTGLAVMFGLFLLSAVLMIVANELPAPTIA